MMRIADYKQVSTRTERRVIHHDELWDDNGNIVANAWDETIEVQVPVMDTVCRDATPEEEAEFERMKSEMPEPEMTTEERLQQVEAVSDMAYVNSELALAMLEGLEG